MRQKVLAYVTAGGVALTLLGVPTTNSPAAAAAPASTPAPATSVPAGANQPGPTFTLLTGDRVRLDKAPDGHQSGTVVYDAGQQGGVVFQQINDSLYAFTGQAVRLIGQGKLDPELFNLTKLAEYGYDDAHATQLPVMTTYPSTGSRQAAVPAPPKGSALKRMLSSIGGESLAVDKSHTTETWAELTRTDSPATKVWLDGKVKAALDVSVPAIGAPQAWQAGYDGKGVKVAVLDTGIDSTHPDFAGRIAVSQSFVAGQTVQDGNGHGTHVASIAAGSGAASAGKYRGVAPGAELVIGKVLSNQGYGNNSDIIAGMEWAAGQGAKVINMSLGGGVTDGTDPLAQAVNRISESSKALFVIAAGNSGANGAMTVESPGSADRALTVGSVDKTAPYSISWFSSRGPRVGDYAVKPEITAPGTDIVAARAAGTGGTGQYRSLSGTSMATPHVTGAGAIVAAQHPDWTGDQLKDALVSTANPNPDTSVTSQGGGMVDLRRTTTTGLVATGTANLGAIEPPYPATSGIVTFRNTSGQPVHADLGLRLFTADAALDKLSPYAAPAGAVTVSPSTLDVPPGGTASIQLTVQFGQLDLASYYGWLEARSGNTVLAHSTVSWTKEVQRHRLTVRGIDRAGVPVTTTCCSIVSLINMDTAAVYFGYYDQGVAVFDGLGADPRLPVGRYAVLSNISDFTAQAPWSLLGETLGGDPELVLDRDRDLVIDARQGHKVEFRTPRPAEPMRDLGLDVNWARVLGQPGYERLRWSQTFGLRDSVYMIPTGRATTGTFTTTVDTELTAPALTMATDGDGAPLLHPRYPQWPVSSRYRDCDNLEYVRCVAPFRSPGVYRVVDVGAGSPTELSKAAVRGQVVLVHEVPNPNVVWASQYRLDTLAADATAAGAAGVLYTIDDAGPQVRWVTRHTDIPVAVLPHTEGEALAKSLQAGPVTIATGGDPISPYIYYLEQAENGALPVDTSYEIEHDKLATIEARYHADAPGQVFRDFRIATTLANGVRESRFPAPFTRTEYVSPAVMWWEFTDWGHSGLGNYQQHEESRRSYAAGSRVVEDHLAAPTFPDTYPGTTALTSSQGTFGSDVFGNLSFSLDPFLTGGQFMQPDASLTGGTVRVVYRKGDQVLCQLDTVGGCTVSPTPGPYTIAVDTSQPIRPVSTATHTEWTVNATFPTGTPAPAPLPLVGYDIPIDLTNSVRAGSTYEVNLAANYQPGYSGTGPFTVQAWVSHDDGATWTSLGDRRTKDGRKASFEIRTPRDAQFVTLRVRATDAAGNSIDQTITRAWKVSQG